MPARDVRGQVAWVLAFIAKDLARTSTRGWRRLEFDLFTRFFGKGWPFGSWTFDPEVAGQLQEIARQTIEDLLAARQSKPRQEQGRVLLRVGADDIREVTFRLDASGVVRTFPLAESLVTAFALRFGLLLAESEAKSISRCPSCQVMFLSGHGLRRFCSDRCKNREAGRQFRRRKGRRAGRRV